MAVIDWPTTLPAPLAGTLEEGLLAAFVSDDADVGAPRRRARFTRTLRRFGFALTMNATEVAALRSFVITTTSGGVEAFNWTHPNTLAVLEVRFASLPQVGQATKGAYRAAIELEEI